MINKQIIAVSQRVNTIPNRNDIYDCIDQELITWLLKIGTIPFPVPNLLDTKLSKWLAILNPSGIILSGGDNIGNNSNRDSTELNLIKYAGSKKLPLLGICRGMQMMAYYENMFLKRIKNHVNVRHKLFGEEIKKNLLPSEVNSYHEYSLKSCPENYQVLAKSKDGSIEAIKHNFYKWEGWMWHPEREKPFSIIDCNRAKKILNLSG